MCIRDRVQLAYGLMIPYSVLLLDEITVDLDVLGRADLMAFLRRECEERSVTIVYATHIFDGLEEFATHVAFVAGGRLRFCEAIEDIEGLRAREPGALLATVEGWLRKEAEIKKESSQSAGSSRRRCSSTSATAGGARDEWRAPCRLDPSSG